MVIVKKVREINLIKMQVIIKMKIALSLGLVATLFASCASGPGGSSGEGPISSENYVIPPESTYLVIKVQSYMGGMAVGFLEGLSARLNGASEEESSEIVRRALKDGRKEGDRQAANVKGEAAQNIALAGSIKDLKLTNSQLASYNSSLRSKLTSMNSATAKANRKQLDKVIKTQRKNVSNLQTVISKSKGSKETRSLAAQVKRLRSEVSSLDKTRAQLLKIEQGTRV